MVNMEMEKVLVTGFGPFGEHKINASWETVKLLPSLNKNVVELIVQEIPVTYKDVDEKIKILWETYKPTVRRTYLFLNLKTKLNSIFVVSCPRWCI